MKLLLDTCVWGGATTPLKSAGHDVRWVGDMESDPGDEAIMQLATAEEGILVTLDKDFGALAIVFGKPHRGIIRLVGIPARQQGPYCEAMLNRFDSELARGAIVTVTRDRVRIRTSDPQEP